MFKRRILCGHKYVWNTTNNIICGDSNGKMSTDVYLYHGNCFRTYFTDMIIGIGVRIIFFAGSVEQV